MSDFEKKEFVNNGGGTLNNVSMTKKSVKQPDYKGKLVVTSELKPGTYVLSAWNRASGKGDFISLAISGEIPTYTDEEKAAFREKFKGNRHETVTATTVDKRPADPSVPF